jgi:hypothetical protein
MSDY